MEELAPGKVSAQGLEQKTGMVTLSEMRGPVEEGVDGGETRWPSLKHTGGNGRWPVDGVTEKVKEGDT